MGSDFSSEEKDYAVRVSEVKATKSRRVVTEAAVPELIKFRTNTYRAEHCVFSEGMEELYQCQKRWKVCWGGCLAQSLLPSTSKPSIFVNPEDYCDYRKTSKNTSFSPSNTVKTFETTSTQEESVEEELENQSPECDTLDDESIRKCLEPKLEAAESSIKDAEHPLNLLRMVEETSVAHRRQRATTICDLAYQRCQQTDDVGVQNHRRCKTTTNLSNKYIDDIPTAERTTTDDTKLTHRRQRTQTVVDFSADIFVSGSNINGETSEEETRLLRRDAMPTCSQSELNDEDATNQLYNAAFEMECSGKLSEALELYIKLVKTQKSRGATSIESSTTLHKVAIVHWKRGAYKQSLEILKYIVKLFKRNYGSSFFDGCVPYADAILLADVYLTTGRVYLSLGDHHTAKQTIKKSLSVLACTEDNEKEDHTERYGYSDAVQARGLHLLGMTYQARGQNARALKHYQEALQQQRIIHGKRHVDVAATITSIASLYLESKKYDKAMTCYGQALRIYRKRKAGSPVDIGVVLANVGWIQFLLKGYDSALISYQESLQILRSSLEDKHRNVVSVEVQIGMLHGECGRYKQALRMYKNALPRQRAVLGDDHQDVAITLEAIGEMYCKLKNATKAVDFFQQALQIRRTILGEKHVDVAVTLVKLGSLYRQCGNNSDHLNEALRSFTNAKQIFLKQKILPTDSRMIQVETEIRSILKPIIKC